MRWSLLLLISASTQFSIAAEPGFIEGHLKVFVPKAVEIAEAGPSKSEPVNYAEYPLIVLSKDGKNEIARVFADDKGNYRLQLLPGDYVLDAEGHVHGHLRAKPRPFKVVSNQTVHVDMDMGTDHSRSNSMQ